jgi:curved DNA-binding protein
VDKNAGAKFGEITEAYDVLTDDEKRRKYDAFGADWEQHQKSGRPDGFDWTKYSSWGGEKTGEPIRNWGNIFEMGHGTSEFFRTIFGRGFEGGDGALFARKGQDLHAELAISLDDAYGGGTKILTIGNRNIRIKLKPGIWDSQKIQIAGKGAPGKNGGESGDLFITFQIQPNPEYRLEGVDLFKEISLDIFSAILGASLEVRTVSGNFELTIPPMTKNGTVFKLNGRGFPVYDKPGRHGDLFLKVALQLPEKLTLQETNLVKRLAELHKEKVEGGTP